MIDRQKVETIMRKRFPSASVAEIAAAANAIMALGDEWEEIESREVAGLVQGFHEGAEIRVFRRVVPQSE
jgi:hypothetical protein